MVPNYQQHRKFLALRQEWDFGNMKITKFQNVEGTKVSIDYNLMSLLDVGLLVQIIFAHLDSNGPYM